MWHLLADSINIPCQERRSELWLDLDLQAPVWPRMALWEEKYSLEGLKSASIIQNLIPQHIAIYCGWTRKWSLPSHVIHITERPSKHQEFQRFLTSKTLPSSLKPETAPTAVTWLVRLTQRNHQNCLLANIMVGYTLLIWREKNNKTKEKIGIILMEIVYTLKMKT